MGRVKTRKVSEFLWEVPVEGAMRVPGRIYADDVTMNILREETQSVQWDALMQVRNVACLPGIQNASLAMADIHPGYGFPIGGVGAFDTDEGVVSLAGVGFDINCGVRTMVIDLPLEEIVKEKESLADELFAAVPAGVGSTGSMKLSLNEIDRVLTEGARFPLERGFGVRDDLEYIEENGVVSGADPSCVSGTAKERQFKQVGTLGSGNHYLEVQHVEEIFDRRAAEIFGLREGTVVASIHTGSRALGHQIGTDYQKILAGASRRYALKIPEAELVAAPIKSDEGKRYIAAVMAGINCGFANRQAVSGTVRKVFEKHFSIGPDSIRNLYEVGHNNLKFETHEVNGRKMRLLVHRKGATRAFAAGSEHVPPRYAAAGNPVLVGGTMGTASWILAGTEKGMKETFGSSVHGAGRLKSRKGALKEYRGSDIIRNLSAEGMAIRVQGARSAAEEAPGAYKDVDRVVAIMEGAGVSRRVARLRPIICIKG